MVHKQGHTYYEVWYKGDDGIEQWHAFDPYIGWYFLNENGEVASCEQLAKNPQLVQNPLPGHPVPLGSHPERSGLGHRHRTEDFVIIDQPLRLEENAWDLKRGMEVTYNFMPEVPHKALFTHHPAGGDEKPWTTAPTARTTTSARSAGWASASMPSTFRTGRTTCGRRRTRTSATRASPSAGTGRGRALAAAAVRGGGGIRRPLRGLRERLPQAEGLALLLRRGLPHPGAVPDLLAGRGL